MTLRVHLPNPWDPEWVERVRTFLDPSVEITTGTERPDPAEYEILVTGRPKEEDLEASPNLKALIIPFAGVPAVTQKTMADYPHVAVHNLHHNAVPTAEMALAHLFAAAKRIVPFDRDLRKGDWGPRYTDLASFLLCGKTVLILGYGAVGRHLAPVLAACGMDVLALRRRATEVEMDGPCEVHPPGDLASLLPRANVLMICLPGTEDTKGYVGEKELGLLPEGAILVNIGRGLIVDQEPLYGALKEERLFGAGIDVWYNYPKSKETVGDTPPGDHPFGELENLVLSPHRAGHVEEDPQLRAEHLARVLNAAGRGEDLPNPVDMEAGY